MESERKGIHYLKCWPKFFGLVASGRKPFEVRKNDRRFEVGDRVVMYEWDPRVAEQLGEAKGYSGREVRGNILSVTAAADSDCLAGVIDGEYVILGMEWTDGIYPKVGGAG